MPPTRPKPLSLNQDSTAYSLFSLFSRIRQRIESEPQRLRKYWKTLRSQRLVVTFKQKFWSLRRNTGYTERDFYALSNAQTRMWLLSRFQENESAYNLPVVFSWKGDFHPNHFQSAMLLILQRHEILRTYFIVRDGIPSQTIAKPPEHFSLSRPTCVTGN